MHITLSIYLKAIKRWYKVDTGRVGHRHCYLLRVGNFLAQTLTQSYYNSNIDKSVIINNINTWLNMQTCP